MPGGRGGRRQGTPGTAYPNRTDLSRNYAPTAGPATTPRPPPQAPPSTPPDGGQPLTGGPVPFGGPYPEDIPKPDDPTARPAEPVTTRPLNTPGFGVPMDPAMDELFAAYRARPTPQLGTVLKLMMDRRR